LSTEKAFARQRAQIANSGVREAPAHNRAEIETVVSALGETTVGLIPIPDTADAVQRWV